MTAPIDYSDHLAAESARFVDALRDAPADRPVPTCPDWVADDLLWHLGEVQWFWGTIVRERIDGEAAQRLKPPRPEGRAALTAFYADASRALANALSGAGPDATPTWTWAPDQTVGFVRRRQAHEALIHRVDAELVAGTRTPLDPRLSADGVDEALRIMYAGVPDWGTFTPDDGQTVRIRATDTGDAWLVRLGRFTGTDPDGTAHDQPDLDVADTADTAADGPAAEISGTAADLDCWLWHRPTLGPLERSGDPDALARLEATIAPGID